jgi:hypothetical protein
MPSGKLTREPGPLKVDADGGGIYVVRKAYQRTYDLFSQSKAFEGSRSSEKHERQSKPANVYEK